VDSNYITGIAALAGSVIGGFTSFLSSWFGQQGQFKSQLRLSDKVRRQELYRDFIVEASALYIDAMTHDTPDPAKTIILYALVSRMRVLSSPKVIDEAETLTRIIVDLYPQANKTFDELHQMAKDRKFDPLHGFAIACREEYEQWN
jgi:hypothetical protein